MAKQQECGEAARGRASRTHNGPTVSAPGANLVEPARKDDAEVVIGRRRGKNPSTPVWIEGKEEGTLLDRPNPLTHRSFP
jgi:hypothetical protein